MRHPSSRLAMLALAGAFVAAAASSRTFAGERYALVIGVHQYDKNQLRSLPYAESDAVAVADRLKAIGFRRVVVMTQSLGAKESRFLPTAANVRDSINGFLDPRKWDEDDTAVIVLSGHGVQFRSEDASYFCPMDARLEKRDTLIDIDEIYRRLEKCPAAFKLLIADCCRNDPQSDFSRARSEVDLESVTRPQRAKPPGGVAAFYSCSAGEKAFESADLKKGVFTHFLLEALSDPRCDLDRDGRVDLDELARFTKRNVTDYVSDQFGESTVQVPELVGKTRGLVPLVELAKLGPDKPIPSKPDVPAKTEAVDLKAIISRTTGMKLMRIPAGEYLRGSLPSEKDAEDDEWPQHRVKISQDFYLGQCEVTQGEWKTVMGTEPWKGRSNVLERQDCAATYVNFADAQEFIAKLSERDGRAYRLPTEAEWEHAARGGSTSRFSFGDDESKIEEHAWIAQNANDVGEKYAHIVGLKKANPFGLHDMHGNVWEWCSDYYSRYEYTGFEGKTALDPQGPQSGFDRMTRGGGWDGGPRYARSADRNSLIPEQRDDSMGFRIAAGLSVK